MPNTIVMGTQWGDEGKGALIDRLAEEHDVIVRYQGGANAGHTVIIKGEKYALHILPSGVLREDKINIIGNNVLVDPIKILDELGGLKKRGITVTPERLRISNRAHVILEYNRKLDAAKGGKIGTTGRAIGPTYADKMDRIGIRVCDLFNGDKNLKDKLQENLELKNHILAFYNAQPISLDSILNPLLKTREELFPFVCEDIKGIIYAHNGSILAEGAQGAMLDIDHGTYPFVTSSNPTIGGFYTGTGCGKIKFDEIIGVLKAYTTRVGNGPFPTELEDETGELLRRQGDEFGTTTGRPRRCGWLDLMIAKEAIGLSGITSLCLTKLDVLSGIDYLNICGAYTVDGKPQNYFPVERLEQCKPTYMELKGWDQDIRNARKLEDLPKEAKNYERLIKDSLATPVKYIGIGPERDQMIIRD